jgi:hypothetical protein
MRQIDECIALKGSNFPSNSLSKSTKRNIIIMRV